MPEFSEQQLADVASPFTATIHHAGAHSRGVPDHGDWSVELNELIQAGDLQTLKVGAITLISVASIDEFLSRQLAA